MKPWRHWLLLILGCFSMVGDLLGIPLLIGLGAASGISPAPRVFGSVRGLETFSTDFELRWTEADGVARRERLTPEVYGRLGGPYNRRNVYGAALAYGPILSMPDHPAHSLYASLLPRALRGPDSALRELGFPTAVGAVDLRVHCIPRAGIPNPGLPLVIEVPMP